MDTMSFDDAHEMEQARRQQKRLDLLEQQQLLEQFANPQDEYEEIDPEDAHLDLQIRNFRDLAKLNLYSAIF